MPPTDNRGGKGSGKDFRNLTPSPLVDLPDGVGIGSSQQ